VNFLARSIGSQTVLLRKGKTVKIVRQLSPIAVVVLLVFASGCGSDGPDVVPVSGTIRLGGEPLSNATVLFTPVAGGRPSAAVTDAEGRYELIYTRDREGALPGEHVVSISTFRDGDPDQDQPPARERVPAQYNVQSQLRQTVTSDTDALDFELIASGRIVEPRY